MSLGEKIKMLREKHGWTQSQAAEKIGISSQVLSNYERNYRSPDKETLSKFALLYNRSLDWLLGISDDDSDKKMIENEDSKVGRAFFGGADQYTEDELEIARAAAQAAVEAYRRGLNKKK